MQRWNLERLQITQRQAALGLLWFQFLAALFLSIQQLYNPIKEREVILFGGIAATLIYGGLLFAFWLGWEYARHTTIVLIMLLVGSTMPEPFVTKYAPLAILVPIVLACVLTDSIWVLGSAIGTWGLLLARAGGQGVYAEPLTIILYFMIVISLIIGRIVTTTARRQASVAEKRYEDIFERSFDGIFQMKPDGQYLAANPAFARLYGYDSVEELMTSGIDLNHQFYVETGDNEFRRQLQEHGAISNFESKIYRKDGSTIWILQNARAIRNEKGTLLYYEGTIQDITKRKRSEEKLHLSDQILQRVNAPVLVADSQGNMIYISPAVKMILGYEPEELLGDNWWKISRSDPDKAQREKEYINQAVQREIPIADETYEHPIQDRWGNTHWISWVDAAGLENTLIGVGHDITERKQMEEKIQRRVAELEALYQSGIAFSQTFNQTEIAEKITEVMRVHLNWHHAAVRVRRGETDELELLAFNRSDGHDDIDTRIQAAVMGAGQGMAGWVTEHGQGLRLGNLNEDPRYVEIYPGMQSGLYVPLKLYNRTLGCISVESDQPDAFTKEDQRLLTTLAVQAAVAIENARLFQSAQQELSERKRAEEELSQRELEYRSLAENIPDIVARFDPQLRYIYINDGIETMTGIPAHSFIGKTNRDLHMPEKLVALWDKNLNRVFESGQARTIEFEFPSLTGLRLFESRLVPELGPSNKVERVLSIARDITDRKLAEIQIRRQFEHLTALRKIDLAIISSFDLHFTLGIVLSQVISQLQVDAADILLLSPDGQTLKYAAGQGFQTKVIEALEVPTGGSRTRYTITKEKTLIQISNLKEHDGDTLLTAQLAGEDFISYYGVPLIAKGKVIGMLEAFRRVPLQPYQEWLDFLDTLAGQAAIAIDNAQLFENLQNSNRELNQAYDATIEGWSHAMDLRDKETEGHTQRVTEMTISLATQMGIPESERVHIKRGALLHDMGKLGVPDHILLKSEDLTDEEWEIMRKHPEFAYEMLSSIGYLKPALNIPYCHHEKWDGSGYPRGLKGDRIPLEARIFAVVDVWDALRSDRPYRKAWSIEKAKQHILEQTGSQFDPKVVEYFLKLINIETN